jgi:hypothetical protein
LFLDKDTITAAIVVGVKILGVAAAIAVTAATVAVTAKSALDQRTQESKLGQRRSDIEQKVSNEPANPKLAWDLARVTLEQYFYKNLRQVGQIFVTAICVMLGGFLLILYGAWIAIHQPATSDLASKLTVLSGLITEFIAATFMVIYRSTLQQANTYMAILEKINAVGMAVQIIESIPATDPLYTQTRSTMAKMLLESFKTIPMTKDAPKSKGPETSS